MLKHIPLQFDLPLRGEKRVIHDSCEPCNFTSRSVAMEMSHAGWKGTKHPGRQAQHQGGKEETNTFQKE